MAHVSKAEVGLWAVGGLAFLGGLILRQTRKIERQTFVNAMIFAAGATTTGFAMTGYRMVSTRRQLGGLGLQQVDEVHTRGGKVLKAWADDEMGVRHRVHLLQGLVAKSVRDPDARRLALAITGYGTRTFKVGDETVTVKGAGCPARDDMCEAKAIFDWVANPHNMRYTGDVGAHVVTPGGKPEAVDYFSTLRRAVETRGEDCDGAAVVNASLGVLNGFPAKFRITSNTGESADHIYTLLGIPKLKPRKWLALDTTLGEGKFRKEPKRAWKVDFDA